MSKRPVIIANTFCLLCRAESESGRVRPAPIYVYSYDVMRSKSTDSAVKVSQEANFQYFLATLCDYQVDPEHRSRLGLRYSNTPEVRRLLSRLQKAKFVSPGAHGACPNAIVSALKV